MRTGAMWSILLVFVKTSFALSAVNKIVSVHFEKLGNKKRNQITEVKEILVNDFFYYKFVKLQNNAVYNFWEQCGLTFF